MEKGKKLFLLFNHEITRLQEEDARESLGAQEIVQLPQALKDLWGNIPPDLPELSEYLEPIQAWLTNEAKAGDYALIQGDFGACFLMVNFAFKRGLVPVYSTTVRKVEEKAEKDGVRLVHHFTHRIFREYGV